MNVGIRKHDEATRRQVVDMRRRGAPWIDIEAATGISRTTGRHWCRDAGVPKRYRGKAYDKQTIERAVRMWADGERIENIEAATGACGASVKNWARERGVERAPRAPHPMRKSVIDLARRGWSRRAISEITGIGRKAIRKWLNAAGVPAIPPGNPRIDPEEVAKIYRQTHSYRKTAERIGCSVFGVRRALDRDIRKRVRAEMESHASA